MPASRREMWARQGEAWLGQVSVLGRGVSVSPSQGVRQVRAEQLPIGWWATGSQPGAERHAQTGGEQPRFTATTRDVRAGFWSGHPTPSHTKPTGTSTPACAAHLRAARQTP